ncbi:MAG: hypothetical protein ABI679_15620 [Gemmatimonadota bacterium]
MTEATFYRWSLLLPVAVPAAVLPAGFIPGVQDIVRPPLQLLLMGSYYGGAPYAVFAVAILLWSLKRPSADIRRFVLYSPFVFSPVAAVGLLVQYPYGWSAQWVFEVTLIGACAGIAYGYFYVAVAELLRRALVRRGRLRSEVPLAAAT